MSQTNSIIYSVICLVFLGLSIWLFNIEWHLYHDGIHVTGRVTEVHSSGSGVDESYTPTISYVCNDRVYMHHPIFFSGYSSVGFKYPIICDKNNPELASIDYPQQIFAPFAFACIGTVLFAFLSVRSFFQNRSGASIRPITSKLRKS